MLDTDTASKPPQISEMLQKFALAFKTKTFEFFAEDDADDESTTAVAAFDGEESADEFITGQKVVVIKPDQKPTKPHIPQTLIPSLFASISSFEAFYLQFQTAHVPYDHDAVTVADRSLVSILQKLSDFKLSYQSFKKNPNSNVEFPSGSGLESQVEENQNMLRTLDSMINRLQSEIDVKDNEVLLLKQNLDTIQSSNLNLSKKLSYSNSGAEVLLSVRVFDSMLRDSCRTMHVFTKLLIDLMKKARWDLDLAASSLFSGIDYAKKRHNRYVFMSYVCLGMFRGFDSFSFGLLEDEIVCNGSDSNSSTSEISLRQLIEHVSCNPIELLSRNQKCNFSKFCENRYKQLINPSMESSIFSNLDRNEVVLDSWRSLSVFYETFVSMASSIWILHKLAFSFDPPVEIFQVENGVEFSNVYMEDVTKKHIFSGNARPKVGFTVVPGFKIGKTVVQSQVYLNGLKCTE